jgi:hypothetical protein
MSLAFYSKSCFIKGDKAAQKAFSHPNLYPKNGLNELNRLFYPNIFLQHTKVLKWRKGEYWDGGGKLYLLLAVSFDKVTTREAGMMKIIALAHVSSAWEKSVVTCIPNKTLCTTKKSQIKT